MTTPADDLHARAALIASEFSLLGLGCGLVVATALMTVLHGQLVLQGGREAAWVGGGLALLGTVTVVSGRHFDVGGTRQRLPALGRTWWVVAGGGAAVAVGALWAAWLPWPQQALVSWHAHWHTRILVATGLVAAVPTVAALGLRSLAAVGRPVVAPLAMLAQSVAHTLLAGTAVLALLAGATAQPQLQTRLSLGVAVATLGVHALLLAVWLLRHSRRTLGTFRDLGLDVPVLERGHLLASAATVVGLVLPALVVVWNVVGGRDSGLMLACGWMAASNHVMRYAWILLGGSRVPRPLHSA